jgi:hypothetical protein
MKKLQNAAFMGQVYLRLGQHTKTLLLEGVFDKQVIKDPQLYLPNL